MLAAYKNWFDQNMKVKIILALSAFTLSALPLAQATDTDVAASSDPVIARGTGIEIKRGDLDDAMAGIKAQIQTLTSAQVTQIQRQVLTNLINTKLLFAKATDADKATATNAVDLQMTALIENAGSQAVFDQHLETNGMTEAILRSKIFQEEVSQAVLQRELKVTVTDNEVKDYYDTYSTEFEQPEMVRISHILIFTVDPVMHSALPAAQLDARSKLSQNIVKAARSGTDFAALAKQYSNDPGSKDNGGELLPFPRGQMAPEIDAAAFSLTNNEISDVITTSVGYQIIKLLEKIPSKKISYLTAMPEIRQGLTRQKFAQLAPAYLDGLQKAANVEILDPGLKAATAAP